VRQPGLSPNSCRFPFGVEWRFAEEEIVALRATRERLPVLQWGKTGLN